MRTIAWLVSYPRSGNTWFRIFLSYLLNEKSSGLTSINEIESTYIGCSRELFDRFSCVSSGELTQMEIENLKPDIFRAFASESKELKLVKLHEACGKTGDGRMLFPSEVTAKVIYIARNPLDMVASISNHSGKSFDDVIGFLANTEFCMGTSPESPQLNQRLGSWSNHVKSWLDHKENDYEVLLMRYEDMSLNDASAFTEATQFLGFEHSNSEIRQACQLASFNRLKSEESSIGYRKKPIHSKIFFRKGQVGSWREELNSDQVARVIEDHRAVMTRLGYLTQSGEPTY